MKFRTFAGFGLCCFLAIAAAAMIARADEQADKAAAEKKAAEKAAAEKKAVDEELKTLQGTWKIDSISFHGRELEEDAIRVIDVRPGAIATNFARSAMRCRADPRPSSRLEVRIM